jgi:hypothetical protein
MAFRFDAGLRVNSMRASQFGAMARPSFAAGFEPSRSRRPVLLFEICCMVDAPEGRNSMPRSRSLLMPALALCSVLAACNAVPTAGSSATPKGQADCIAAAARRHNAPADQFKVLDSEMTMSSDVYEVHLRNSVTGRRSKCTVDQNGIVTGVIDLR